jgi:hypothetical protein
VNVVYAFKWSVGDDIDHIGADDIVTVECMEEKCMNPEGRISVMRFGDIVECVPYGQQVCDINSGCAACRTKQAGSKKDIILVEDNDHDIAGSGSRAEESSRIEQRQWYSPSQEHQPTCKYSSRLIEAINQYDFKTTD